MISGGLAWRALASTLGMESKERITVSSDCWWRGSASDWCRIREGRCAGWDLGWALQKGILCPSRSEQGRVLVTQGLAEVGPGDGSCCLLSCP